MNEQTSNLQVTKTATGTVYAFYILDYIEPDGKVWDWTTGEYKTVESCTSQRYFVEQLAAVKAGDTVELHINSPGGDVKEALGIYNNLRRCPATVVSYIDGFACSAASVLAMAAQTVIMPRASAMMLHNAAMVTYGNAMELRKAADDLEVINTAALHCYLQHAAGRMDEATLREICDAETWLTAEQCIAYGLADQYAEEDIDLTTTAQAFAASMQATSLAAVKAVAPPPGVRAALKGTAPAGAAPQAGTSAPQTPPQAAQAKADAAPHIDPPAEPAPGPAEQEPASGGLMKLLKAMTETTDKQ